jgi:hypothetical protein
MIRSIVSKITIVVLLFCIVHNSTLAQVKPIEKKWLQNKYNLASEHSRDIQYFVMTTSVLRYALDGTRMEPDSFKLYLRCIPAGEGKDEYTCLKFTLHSGTSDEISIPSLTNWKYIFQRTATERDEKGQVLGIDHAPFENLVDNNGRPVPVDKSYFIYNAFIDFHSMNVFADRSPMGKGVQDLSSIGEKIIHSASFSEPPVDLGNRISKGSVFKNGEITLTFKGLGLVNENACAILEYDSGESSFTMLMKPIPTMEISTKGSSHYWGDIFKSLQNGWIQKASLHEIVVSETTIPNQSNKITGVIERSITIENVPSIRF